MIAQPISTARRDGLALGALNKAASERVTGALTDAR